MVAPSPSPKGGAPTRTLAAPLGNALRDNETLAGLLSRLAESQARWAAVVPSLAAELAGAARPGPLDDKAWVILADHASAAAKLRQCLPEIEGTLVAKGWLTPPVKIKVRPRGS